MNLSCYSSVLFSELGFIQFSNLVIVFFLVLYFLLLFGTQIVATHIGSAFYASHTSELRLGLLVLLVVSLLVIPMVYVLASSYDVFTPAGNLYFYAYQWG